MRLTNRNLTRFVSAGLLATAIVLGAFVSSSYAGTSRIKDIVNIEGVRDNQLVGYGLVVGLNGTGDSLGSSPFTEQSLISMLERLGVNVREQNLSTGNVAAVMVTGTLPPFTNQGSRIDITVSTLGDSSSLQGGTLLVTPLMGADGEVYAVGQGPVSISGFSVAGNAATVTQNIPTNGRIPGGAIVEREIGFNLADLNTVRFGLKNPDFTTARRIAGVINASLGSGVAVVENPSSIVVDRARAGNKRIVDLITDIENLEVVPDQPARIVIDERSGVIVMGADVRVSTVAIAQQNLTIRIAETPQVSQPNALSENGDTVVVPRTNIDVTNASNNGTLGIVPDSVTLQDLVASLNALGIAPRDVITILQAIKAAGALQAEIEVM